MILNNFRIQAFGWTVNLSNAKNLRSDKPIVVATHYPLACSAFYTYHCTETLYYIISNNIFN